MASIEGSRVEVKVTPDTRGFREDLLAYLRRVENGLTLSVGLDPDTARLKATQRRVEGTKLKQTVLLEGDPSGLRRIQQEYDRARKQWESRPVTSKYELDADSLWKDLARIDKAAEQSSRHVSGLAKSTGSDISRQIDQLKGKASDYAETEKRLSEQRTRLISRETSERDRLTEAIRQGQRVQANQTAQVNKLKADLKSYRAAAREAKKAGNEALYLHYDETVIPEAQRQLDEWRTALRRTDREVKSAQSSLDKLFGKKYQTELARLNKGLETTRSKLAETKTEIRGLSDSMDKTPFDSFTAANRKLAEGLSRTVRMEQQHEQLLKRQAKAVPDLSAGQQALSKALRGTTINSAALNDNLARGRSAMARNQREAKELTSLLDEQKKSVTALSKAFRDFKPLGVGKIGTQLADAIREIDAYRKKAERMPLVVKAQLDNGMWTRQYAKIMRDAEELRRKLEKQHEIDVRVKVWDDQADQFEERLNRLRRQRLDIPVDWQVDQEKIIARMREIARQIKANPDRQWELEANLDLQVKHAEEKFKRYQESHDKIEADLDLKTAGARAHMLAFTRPRSVEIFARLNTTQAGKILNGMLYGSTGLKGVENQFQRLVDVFDKFDKVVPTIAVVEGAVGALSAGAINLSRSALGVGASLATMTKAAMAAPGAIVGLGAAFTVLRHAWGDKGGTFSEQIDIATTKLNGLGDAMDDAFYKKAKPAIRSLMDDVSGKLIPGITGIAEAEGTVVEGLADVIRKSYEADELPRIFTRSQEAIDKLTPGLQDLVRSFLGLGDATSQYLPRAAQYLSDAAAKTAAWVEQAKNTGQISLAMAEAVEQGGYLKESVKSLWGVLTGLYSGLAETENGIQGFSEALGSANKAVNSSRFQEVLKAWAEGAQDAQHTVRDAFTDIGSAAYELKDTTADVLRDAGEIVASVSSNVSRLLRASKTGISEFSSGIKDGFTVAMDAIGDAGPMFDDLLTMVGQLSRTFGGTFAATLKASAPLIQALAKGAEATATEFAKLPQPVQAAIGMYMTFGRAGKELFDTFKVGMLENTLKTAEWAKQLNSLGVTMSGSVKPSLLDIAAGWGAVKSGAAGISTSVASAGKTVEGMAGSAGKAATKLDKLKLAGSGVTSMISGINPATVALAAVVGTATIAWADYTAKAQATESANQAVNDSLGNLKYEVGEAGKAVSNLSQSIQEAFTTEGYGQAGKTWFEDMFGTQSGAKFKTTADAAKQLGVSMGTLEKMTRASDGEYRKWLNSLDKGDLIVTDSTALLDANASAYRTVEDGVTDLRKSMRDQIRTTAEANGWSESYIKKLMEGGGATEFMALKAKSAAEQTADYTNATQLLVDTLDQEKNARINAANAASAYGRTMSTIGETVKRVQALAAQGQRVWDDQALSFDFTTEAGRTASDTLNSLASSANNVLDTMISSGASYDEVSKRQQQLQQDLYDTGDQLTNNATGVHQYTDSLLRTPSEIKTKIELQAEQSKAALLQYVSQIEKLFPEGQQGDAVYQTVLRMSAQGAITSMDQVNEAKDRMLQGLKNGDMVITVDADGQKAVATYAEVQRLGGELQKDGTWKVSVSADTLAANTNIDELLTKLDRSGLDQKQITMFVNAEGNAELTLSDVQSSLANLGMSKKDIQFILDSQGNAPEQMAMVEQKLRDLGASDKQIEWFLNAIDQTLTGTTSAQANIDGVKQRHPASIEALDMTGSQVTAAQQLIDTVKQQKPAELEAFNDTSGPVWDALQEIRKIPAETWAKILANGDQAKDEIQKIINTHIPDKSFRIIQHYEVDQSQGAKPLGGQVSSAWATGGRISGPGTGTSDSIPAWVSNGEHMIRAASVRKLDAAYGKGFLDYLNEHGSLPAKMPVSGRTASFRDQRRAFASGGRVNALGADRWNVEINPVIKVELPNNAGETNTNVTLNYQDTSPAVRREIESFVSNVRRLTNMR